MIRKKPWLKGGLALDRRIELGLPELTKLIQPEKAKWGKWGKWQQPVEAFTDYAPRSIRIIATTDVPLALPRRVFLNAAVKLREAREALVAVSSRDDDLLQSLADWADHYEARASTRTGGSRQARIDKLLKEECVDLALTFISVWSPNQPISTTKDKFLDQLAELLFEIASGRRGSVTKAVKAYFQKYKPELSKPRPTRD